MLTIKISEIMSTKSYIPTIQKDYFDFQEELTTQVTTNAALWNIPPDKANELQTRSTDYATVYNPIKNKRTRTVQQVLAHDDYKKDYTRFLREMVQGYLVNNPAIPNADKSAMGLNPRTGVRTPRTKILTMPNGSIKALGGGLARLEFRVEADSNRVSREPSSNGVEYATRFTRVGSIVPVPTAPPVSPAPPANENPESPDTMATLSEPTVVRTERMDGYHYNVHFSTRARFVVDTHQQGMRMHVRARWVNTTTPDLSSSWSDEVTAIIS